MLRKGLIGEKELLPQLYEQLLVELLFVQPYIRISNIVDSGLAHRQTAGKHLKALCDIGFLEVVKRGRENLYFNKGFIDLLKLN